MSNKKKILVVPIMGVGHTNSCIGLANSLLKHGYQIGFFIDDTYAKKLKPYGFEEFVFDNSLKSSVPGKDVANCLLECGVIGQPDIMKQAENIINTMFRSDEAHRKVIQHDSALKMVIKQFKPDLFILDMGIMPPAIRQSKKPWINNVSTVPLIYLTDYEQFPPGWSGYSIEVPDKTKWDNFKKIVRLMNYDKILNDKLEKLGYERFPDDNCRPDTAALNVYAFPEEYNYEPLKWMENWFNIEVFNKVDNSEKVELKDLIPEKFFKDDLDGKWSGKWIYFTLGSMGSVWIELMRRLMRALAKTEHKYIISLGPRHEELAMDLTRNMWGDSYLPQLKLLPTVDLVITHGGNNTVTETFQFGKPMIIVPLFADQHDNGQRLHETNWAIRLDPYRFTDEELSESIDLLLNDRDLKESLDRASKRIKSIDQHSKFCQLVKKILDQHEIEEKSK